MVSWISTAKQWAHSNPQVESHFGGTACDTWWYLMILRDPSGYLCWISLGKKGILWGLISDDLWRFSPWFCLSDGHLVQGTADPMLRCSGQPRLLCCAVICGEISGVDLHSIVFKMFKVQDIFIHLQTGNFMWHMVINSNQHVRVAWSCTYVKPVNFEGFKRFKSVLLLTSSLPWRRARLDGKIRWISAALASWRILRSQAPKKRTFKKYSYRHRLRNIQELSHGVIWEVSKSWGYPL